MMKSVQSVAPPLMMTILLLLMMLMMKAPVSTAPLPPFIVASSHEDDTVSSPPYETIERNITWFDTREDLNDSQSINGSQIFSVLDAPQVARLSIRRCALATCGTANLASSLQFGDEKAGGAASDPFGNGKK